LSTLFKFFNLERGLLVGALLLVGGITGSVLTVAEWGRHSFGALNPSQTFRAAIPSVLALSLGLEVMLASFFLSMLGLRLRHRETT
jgi:hypothetical protein